MVFCCLKGNEPSQEPPKWDHSNSIAIMKLGEEILGAYVIFLFH
jgi:hypothetical protein